MKTTGMDSSYFQKVNVMAELFIIVFDTVC